MTHAHTTTPPTPVFAPVTVAPPRRSRVYLHAVAAVEQAGIFRARLDDEAARAAVLGEVAVRDTEIAHDEARVQAEARLGFVVWDDPVSVALALRDALVFREVSPVAARTAQQLAARFGRWGVEVEIGTGTVALGATS